MKIGRIIGKLIGFRNVAETFIFRTGSNMHWFTQFFNFRHCFFAPHTGMNEVCNFTFRQKVHWNHHELQTCTSMQKKHIPIITETINPFCSISGFIDNGFILFTAMAHFHNGKSHPFVINKICLCFSKHFFRQNCRTSVKVMYAFHLYPPGYIFSI
ncbi:MAG: hypothetical protein BWX46_00849 [Candidatus Cloacimonetes bacterium ADurb.Bin003]|nr:MAG: hypothetical protein BWX46_00849 [Candidatus Cloacimonetes bacterium ADurb.Bin003]